MIGREKRWTRCWKVSDVTADALTVWWYSTGAVRYKCWRVYVCVVEHPFSAVCTCADFCVCAGMGDILKTWLRYVAVCTCADINVCVCMHGRRHGWYTKDVIALCGSLYMRWHQCVCVCMGAGMGAVRLHNRRDIDLEDWNAINGWMSGNKWHPVVHTPPSFFIWIYSWKVENYYSEKWI